MHKLPPDRIKVIHRLLDSSRPGDVIELKGLIDQPLFGLKIALQFPPHAAFSGFVAAVSKVGSSVEIDRVGKFAPAGQFAFGDGAPCVKAVAWGPEALESLKRVKAAIELWDQYRESFDPVDGASAVAIDLDQLSISVASNPKPAGRLKSLLRRWASAAGIAIGTLASVAQIAQVLSPPVFSAPATLSVHVKHEAGCEGNLIFGSSKITWVSTCGNSAWPNYGSEVTVAGAHILLRAQNAVIGFDIVGQTDLSPLISRASRPR